MIDNHDDDRPLGSMINLTMPMIDDESSTDSRTSDSAAASMSYHSSSSSSSDDDDDTEEDSRDEDTEEDSPMSDSDDDVMEVAKVPPPVDVITDSIHVTTDLTSLSEKELLETIYYERLRIKQLEDTIEKYISKKVDSNQIIAPYLKLNPSLYKQLLATEALVHKTDEDITISPDTYAITPHAIPIRADVRTIPWDKLRKAAHFDVIMMDPPWVLASANPTRGVALGYSQLQDNEIKNMQIAKLSQDGFIFIWVINARYTYGIELMEHWGYKFVDEIVWVKKTVNRRLAKSHGFYLQHAKESCLVGVKGNPACTKKVLPDVIYSLRRGQSQKPTQMYELIEELVPNGKYIEIFGRKNNLRDFWVTIGNEL